MNKHQEQHQDIQNQENVIIITSNENNNERINTKENIYENKHTSPTCKTTLLFIFVVGVGAYLVSYFNIFGANQFRDSYFRFKFPKRQEYENESAGQKAKFADALFNYPNNEYLKQIQRWRLNKLYNISEYKTELPLCISIVGISTQKSYYQMINSVFRQQYRNYKISFIDDLSGIDVKNKIQQLFSFNKQKKQSENVQIQVSETYNQKRLFGLKNRHNSVIRDCSEGDIIVQTDVDDELIGSQVFQLVNTLYQREDSAWAIYLNMMSYDNDNKNYPKMKEGNLGPISDEVFKSNSYRTSYLWKTTALKTYKRKLYMKIDPLDYLDSNNKFYIEKPDAFIHFALAQLAGKEHIVKVDEPVYYYNYDPLYFQRQRIKAKKIIARYASNLLVPYQNLQSLDDDAQKVQNYVYPDATVQSYRKFQKKRPNLAKLIRVTP